MYPSPEMPAYGVFVKNFVGSIQDQKDMEITSFSLISGRRKGITSIFTYVRFFFDIFFKSNFGKHDLIYVHFVKHSLLPLNLWWRRADKKLVLNAHGTDILGKGKVADLFRNTNNRLMRNADLFVVPSDFFISKIQHLGIERRKIFVSASGGINPNIFYPSNDKNPNTGKIGYFGRLDSGKGFDVLLNAFLEIYEKHDLQLEVIGGGELENHFNSYCSELRINNRIMFRGMLQQTQSADLIRNWDLMVFPSELEESLGLVGLEAMACGVPVVGSNIGGITTYLINNLNGFTFEKGDAKELKNKILNYYLMDEKEQRFLSNNAIQTSKDFEIQKVSERLSSKLRSL
tara:strand:- start:3965 stop:4999 length:1035 start_codon:yes stop_codon:yes gene_type:complete